MSLSLSKILTLHNNIVHIKSVQKMKIKIKITTTLRYFLEKCCYQLSIKYLEIFLRSIIIVRFGERKISKEKLGC